MAQSRKQIRTTSSQEGEAQEVEARQARHAAVVIHAAPTVEGKRVQPVIRGAEAGCPDHRGKAPQIQLGRCLAEGGRTGLGDRADDIDKVVLIDPFVDAAQHPGLFEIGVGDETSEPAGTVGGHAADRHEASYQRNAEPLQGREIHLAPIVASDYLHRGVTPGPLEIFDFVPSFVELTYPVQPPVDVAATVRTRQPDMFADRDRHVVTRSAQLVRDLYP